MKRVLIGILMIAGLVFVPLISSAQDQDKDKEAPKESKPQKPPEMRPLGANKLEFTLKELQDGKVTNTRTYMMVMDDNYHFSEVKIGSRVPVRNVTGDVNYMDVGTNIHCNRVIGQPPWVSLDCTVEVSSFSLPDQKLAAGSNTAPILNQMRSSIPAVVQEGKQTVIGIIDDPSSTKRYEIAVTATKVK